MQAAVLLGALLVAAPLFSQPARSPEPRVKDGKFLWFLLSESKQDIFDMLGQPTEVADFSADFQAWRYRIGTIDHEDFSHLVVMRKSDHSIVSVTRNYDPERNVDVLFPEKESSVHHYPDGANPVYSIRVRRLTGGRVLMAMGVSKPGQTTGQLVLIREPELRYFYPWLLEQLSH